MTGRAVLPIFVAALLIAAGISAAAAQALGPNEATDPSPQVQPNFALTGQQRSAIYNLVQRQRPHTSGVRIPLMVGAPVPRSAQLLSLPDEAMNEAMIAAMGDEDAVQFLKYAMVDGNVVVVDSLNMRVIDVIHGSARP
jgi:hypothetical protein